MTVRASAAFLLLAGVALAGCSGGGGGGPATGDRCELEPALCDPDHYLAGHHCIVNDVHPRAYAPDTPGPDTQADPWRPGDYWRYRLRTSEGVDTTSELVYYEDIDHDGAGRAQHYLVGTASPQEALDHALFSVNPMLGRIHRTLYSPHESGLHADMFHFPLCEGSEWTTEFYGATFDLRATRADIPLPGGAASPGFRIEGASADGSTLRHTYSPAARWFTQIDLQRADGLRVQMDLVEHGSGRTGTYHFLRAQQDEVLDLGAIGATPAIVGRQDGGEGPYTGIAVWIDAQRTVGGGRVEVHLRSPSGQSVACVGFDGQGLGGDSPCPPGPLKAQVPYSAGNWQVSVERPLGAIDQSTRVAGEMRIVSVYDRSGTV